MNQMLPSRFAEEWVTVGRLAEIPVQGARVVRSRHGDIAVFRAADDTIFALRNECPHKGGPLSEGIVHGHSVTCPLHNWVISLKTGTVEGPDEGCARVIAVRVDDGVISLDLGRFAEVAA